MVVSEYVPSEEKAMSMLDKLKGLVKGHESTARKGVDRAGDAVDQKTKNKHSDQVDAAQQRINDQLGTGEPQSGEHPPQS
jgi:hypothetical protein